MIYKIAIKSDAYSNTTDEIYIETSMPKSQVLEASEEFKKCYLDKKDKYPKQLSGGEQQKVSIARAFGPSAKRVDVETINLFY